MPKKTIGYNEWMVELQKEEPFCTTTYWSDDEKRFLHNAVAKGYSCRQISKVLGKTADAVNKYLHRNPPPADKATE